MNKTRVELKAIAYDKFMDAAEIGGVDMKVSAITLSAVYHAELSRQTNKNNKDNQIMKTVMDAVNEYEGIAPEPCYAENKDQIIMAVKPFDGYLIGDLTTGDGVRDNEYWKVICTREQFNTRVQECMTNFGSSVTYDEYLKELWAIAPDGATHYDTSTGCYPWIKDTGDTVSYWYINKWTAYPRGVDNGRVIKPKPQPKESNINPVFTQAMSDNGELPSVGMECMVKNKCDAHPQLKRATIKYIGDLVIYSYVENGERCDSNINLVFRPIDTRTDKEKAIDEACGIIDDSQRCLDTNINIDCSAAQKAVIITMINNGYKKT